MKNLAIVLSFVLLASALSAPVAGQPASPVSQPATSSMPAGKASVLATVGEAKITSDQVDKILAMVSAGGDIPADKIPMIRGKILEKMVMQELTRSFVVAKKIEVTADELKDKKDAIAKQAAAMDMSLEKFMESNGVTEDMIRDEIRLKKVLDDVRKDDKAKVFVKAHPDYFDGTSVKASHILVKLDPWAPTADQKAALAKLEGIAADVKAGKIKFEEAAKQFSDCPSKEKGGDLGEFTFDRMVPPFSVTAFAAKVGDTTGIIRTQFGFHIINVTARTEGKDAPGEKAEEVAKRALVSEMETAIFQLPLTTCPIVMPK